MANLEVITIEVDISTLESEQFTTTSMITQTQIEADVAIAGPRGQAGATGSPGAAATVTVGTTTTGTAGSNASVTNAGSSSAAVLDFTIPTGTTGAAGPNTVTSSTSTTLSGLLKGNGSNVGTATAGTDYLLPAGTGAALSGVLHTTGNEAATGNKTLVVLDNGGAVFNVKASPFGAKGDGITDDTAAILASLSSITSAGGGRLYFPAGTYLVHTVLDIPSNTEVFGAGIDVTTIRIDAAAGTSGWGSGSYIIRDGTGGTNIQVHDLSLDGAGTALTSLAGLISPGSWWYVHNVHLLNASNGFKMFVNGVSNVYIREVHWSLSVGNADNLGGGGGASNIIIERCYWDNNVSGNCLDLTTATQIIVRNNYFQNSGIYFEGVTDSTFEGNTVVDTGIGIGTEAGYSPSTLNYPRGVRILNNDFDLTGGTRTVGVSINYRDYSGATTRNPGGGNVVMGNKILNAQASGIAIFGDNNKLAGDTVVGNTVVNPNANGQNTQNTGNGVFDNAGIVIGYGYGDTVSGNSVVDNRSTALMQYGISLTGASTSGRVSSTTVTGNSILGATTSVGIDVLVPSYLTNSVVRSNTGSTYTTVQAITEGGTGSTTQNFVDLSTSQTAIGGNKGFTGVLTAVGEVVNLDATGGYTSRGYRAIVTETNGSGGSDVSVYNSQGSNAAAAFNFKRSDGTATYFSVSTAGVATVQTKLDTPALQVSTSPTAGYVLTSDASGNATWQSINATTIENDVMPLIIALG